MNIDYGDVDEVVIVLSIDDVNSKSISENLVVSTFPYCP